uniref:Uncharacterized protein n=1 Tax=Oryza barthii TaxID=65489 RepID=A0A0D3FU84_9ORYZ
MVMPPLTSMFAIESMVTSSHSPTPRQHHLYMHQGIDILAAACDILKRLTAVSAVTTLEPLLFKPVIVSGLDLHDILVVANSADAITGVSTTASDFDLKIVIAAGAVAVLLAMFPCS